MGCLDLSLELLEDSEGSLLGDSFRDCGFPGGDLLCLEESVDGLELSFDLLEDSEGSLLGDSFLD